jgi:hypothetical protein
MEQEKFITVLTKCSKQTLTCVRWVQSAPFNPQTFLLNVFDSFLYVLLLEHWAPTSSKRWIFHDKHNCFVRGLISHNFPQIQFEVPFMLLNIHKIEDSLNIKRC